MLYVKDGVPPVFSDPLSILMWKGIRPELDADGERWDTKNAQRRYAVWCREAKKNGIAVPEFEIWRAMLDNGSYRMLSTDNRPITEDNESYPIPYQSIPDQSIPDQSIPDQNTAAPHPDGVQSGEKRGKIFGQDSNAYKLASFLADSISQRMPSTERADENTIQAWAREFEKCRKQDKHQWEEIEDVLIWSQRDKFWQANILTGKKFRRNYMNLLARMQRDEQR
jgi:hypothetical protein